MTVLTLVSISILLVTVAAWLSYLQLKEMQRLDAENEKLKDRVAELHAIIMDNYK